MRVGAEEELEQRARETRMIEDTYIPNFKNHPHVRQQRDPRDKEQE